MDTEVKNINEDDYDWTEQLAPHPIKEGSRSWHLYDLLSSLGGKATLTEMWRMVPASDLDPKPKNKQQLRDWIGQSGTSKGYTVKIKKDHYRIATLEEYEAVIQKNKASVRKYRAKKNRQAARAAAKAATTSLVLEQPVVKQPVVKQPVVEQPVVKQSVVEPPVVEPPNTSSQFAQQYLGALLGTTCAIVLFYMVLKVSV